MTFRDKIAELEKILKDSGYRVSTTGDKGVFNVCIQCDKSKEKPWFHYVRVANVRVGEIEHELTSEATLALKPDVLTVLKRGAKGLYEDLPF